LNVSLLPPSWASPWRHSHHSPMVPLLRYAAKPAKSSRHHVRDGPSARSVPCKAAITAPLRDDVNLGGGVLAGRDRTGRSRLLQVGPEPENVSPAARGTRIRVAVPW
jgi:hypothetical protein